MAGEVGSLKISIFPVMRGFRAQMVGQARQAGTESGGILSRLFAKSGHDAGQKAGAQLKSAFSAASRSMKSPELTKLNDQIYKLGRTVTSEHVRMLDAQDKVRVAQTKLNETVAKYGADSSRAQAAQARLNAAQRTATEYSQRYQQDLEKLKPLQQQRNELEKSYAPAKYSSAISQIKTLGTVITRSMAEYGRASKQVKSAQNDLEKAVAKYGVGSKQAAKAQQELERAQAKAGEASGRYQRAVEKLTTAEKQASEASKKFKAPQTSGWTNGINRIREAFSNLNHTRLDGAAGAVQSAGSKVQTIGSKLKAGTIALGTAIGNAVSNAASQVKDFAADCMQEYNEASEIVAKFNNVAENNHWSKAQTEALSEYADKLKEIGVVDDDVTRAGMAQLGTFKLTASQIKTLTPALDEMLAHQKGVNATTQDAVGIGNLMGKVMTGSTSALSRYGVTLTKAQKETLEHGNAMKKASTLAEVLSDNFGHANEKLAQTPVGKMQQFKMAVDDMKKSLGGSFSTVLLAVAPTIQAGLDKAQKPVENFAQWFKTAIKGITGALRTGNISAEMQKAFGVNAKPILDGIKDIKAGFKAAADGIRSGFRSLSSGSKDASQNVSPLAEIFKTLGGAIKLVGQVAGELGKHLKGLLIIGTIAAGVTGFVRAIQTAKKAIDAFKTAQALLNIVLSANPFGVIVVAIAAVVTTLAVLEKKYHIFEKAGAAIKKAWQGVSKFFQNLGKNLGKWFQSAGKDIQKHFSDARKGVEKKWKDIGKWAKGVAKKAQSGFKGVQKGIGRYFDGAQKVSTKIWAKTPSWFKNSVAGKIVSHFVDFPSKISKFFRDPIGTIKSIWNGITRWFHELPGRISGFFHSIPGKIEGFFRDAGRRIKGVWNSVVDWFRSIPDKIAGFFRSIPSRMGKIGRNIVEGLKNGISNSIGSVARVITGGMHNAIDSVKHALGIHSPSTVMRDQVGRFIGLGMADGIRASMPAVATAMEDMAAVPAATRVSVPRVRTVDSIASDGYRQSGVIMTHDDAVAIVRSVESLHRDLGPTISRFAPTATPAEYRRGIVAALNGRI